MSFRTARLIALPLCLLLVMAVAATGLSCFSRAKLASAPPGLSAPADESAARQEMALDKSAEARTGAPAAAPPEGGGSSSSTPPENQLDVHQVRAKQMIIWKARYDVRVEQAAEAADQLRALVEKNQGFISSQDKQVDESGNTRVTVEARVPSEKFWDTVNGLETLGKVESGNTTSENVTEEWVDLAARLHIKELRKGQLEALLKRAQSTEEIDQRQQQILAVQEEIERIQGRQRYLQDQVALSTIRATFYEKGLAPVGKPGPFSLKNTFLRSWYYLLEVLKVLFAVALFIALPLSVVWVPLLIWWLVKRARGRAASP